MVKNHKSQCSKLAPLINNRELWTLLTDYLAEEEHSLVTRLMNCNATDLPLLQGELRGIQKIKNMHDNLLAEKGQPKR